MKQSCKRSLKQKSARTADKNLKQQAERRYIVLHIVKKNIILKRRKIKWKKGPLRTFFRELEQIFPGNLNSSTFLEVSFYNKKTFSLLSCKELIISCIYIFGILTFKSFRPFIAFINHYIF